MDLIDSGGRRRSLISTLQRASPEFAHRAQRAATGAVGADTAPGTLALMLPEPLACFLFRRLWSELMVLARWLRWPSTVSRVPGTRRSSRAFGSTWPYPAGWFSDWPERAWVERSKGRHESAGDAPKLLSHLQLASTRRSRRFGVGIAWSVAEASFAQRPLQT